MELRQSHPQHCRGVKLSNDTHRSNTNPEALLARKSNAHQAELSDRGHVLTENRHALVVDCRVTLADRFVAEMRRLGVTPHVAQNTARSGGSAIDRRTTRHKGDATSINARRGIEKIFGWIKESATCASSSCGARRTSAGCLACM